MTMADKMQALRAKMAEKGLNAYIISMYTFLEKFYWRCVSVC